MRMPKRGEKGFTLIELLIVVAILGVLAAVVIPNVGRFIGRGEEEAADTELTNVQTAIVAMMVDNQLSTIPNVVGSATSDMDAFPDTASVCAVADEKLKDPNGNDYLVATDRDGYRLYHHDIIGSDGFGRDGSASSNATLVNYVATQTTKGTYTTDASGTVTQVTTGYE